LITTPASFTPTLARVEGAPLRTFVFRNYDILVHASDAALPDEATSARLGHDPAAEIPVGIWGSDYCRAIWVPKSAVAPEGYEFKGLRTLWTRVDDDFLAVAGRALQLADWARTHRFCGSCGQPMTLAPGERAMKCACGHTAYPRVSPAMMVLVKKGPAILLARNVAVPAGGRMSALAGFVEAGESIEDAIHREVREEVGVEVTDLALLRQPVVAVPALAHDRVHRRVRGRRHPLRPRGDRRGALVRAGRRVAGALAAAVDLARADRRQPAATLNRPERTPRWQTLDRIDSPDSPLFFTSCLLPGRTGKASRGECGE
jgi:NAD+ diphosphatase